MAKRRPEWDFDATTTVESNRRVITSADECLCCGHVHRNKGASILRCWVPIQQPDGRRRACKCAVYDGLRSDSKTRVVGPYWAYGGWRPDMYGLHLWSHEERAFTGWSLCGAEEMTRGLEKQRRGMPLSGFCTVCEKHPFAIRAENGADPELLAAAWRAAAALKELCAPK